MICASPNDVIVHGIPGDRGARGGRHHLDRLRRDRRRLARRRRLHRRRSATIDAEAPRLIEVTEAVARRRHRRDGRRAPPRRHRPRRAGGGRGAPGSRWCGSYTGHGIGRAMHEEPESPTTASPARARKLRAGNVLAVEPMVSAGSARDRCSTTAGPSSPPTAPGPPTPSTPSPSPTTAPRSSPCSSSPLGVHRADVQAVTAGTPVPRPRCGRAHA